MTFKAYQIEELNGVFSGSVKTLETPSIDEGHIIVKVDYSSLNYKDALAASGVKGIVRQYPFIPGIDSAGTVIQTSSKDFLVGDKIILTGYKMGMSVNGGFGGIVHAPANWAVKLPDGLTLLQSMEIGTAGLTAAASVKKLEDANISKKLPVLVSGATGGVGSIAMNILAKLGYTVHALTGKSDQVDILKSMGSTESIDRDKFLENGIKALDKALYGGAIDTVGGDILSKILSIVDNGGVVTSCGNVAGAKFTSSVFPFILRGISLHGIDSAESPIELKKALWDNLANDWKVLLQNQTKIIKLEEIGPEIEKILDGKQIGRIIIKHGE